MAEETKMCPFCGEEILAVAKKCKHCGEFLEDIATVNTSKTSTFNDKFDYLKNVNEQWKNRFSIIEQYYQNGNYWKLKQETIELIKDKKISFNEVYNNIYFKNGGFGSSLAAFCFGIFYYLVKGMWQKAIVYGIILLLTAFFLPKGLCMGLGAIWMLFAPFDYYRLKVLGKQW